MVFLIFLLLLGGLYLLWRAQRQQTQSGLPRGRVIYVDSSAWDEVPKAFYDPVTNLTGKPDYIVQQGEMVIPVEVKSSRVKDVPYDGHVYQLAAYCLLIEKHFGVRPSYGILHYPNRTFEIPYTPALENALRTVLREIQAGERRRNLPRNHTQAARCQGCGYRHLCDQKLI